MTDISEQFATRAARLLQGTVQACAARALRLAQSGADRAEATVPAVDARLAILARAGLRLTELSHQCIEQLLKQGQSSARNALADSAERLRLTARASSLGALYEEQRASLRASRARVMGELQATWQIVAAAGRELTHLARSTGSELASGREVAPGHSRRGARGAGARRSSKTASRSKNTGDARSGKA